MRVLFAIFFLATTISTVLEAQENKYWLELSDKLESPYRIDQPQEFLSLEAIERRLSQGIAINLQDLPVSPVYCSKVRERGAKVLYSSKWFNALAISCDHQTKINLAKLPFVKSIRLIGFTHDKIKSDTNSGTQEIENQTPVFGFESQQMELLNGRFLHESNFRGNGKMIAVLDGGFSGIDTNVFFDSLRNKQLLLNGRDFVEGSREVYHSGSHGTKVLSLMAANSPGVLMGMAPDAKYVCIRTEDQSLEMPIEECNWIAGAEYADSLGADIITSSLGYSRFNIASMNYDYEDMDGKTSLITQAADIAFSKGILVVTSAGNNGNEVNGFIDAPGDAVNILTVGAIDLNGKVASFSSYGPTADGRIKPEIVAPGKDVTVAAIYNGRVYNASGTSYAAPLVAGLAAALWSAFPEKTNNEIREAIILSAEHPFNRNNRSGAGLPDFKKAYDILNIPINKR